MHTHTDTELHTRDQRGMSIEPERRKKELMRERVIYFFKTRTYFPTCRRLLLSQLSLIFFTV